MPSAGLATRNSTIRSASSPTPQRCEPYFSMVFVG